jgi:large subunit ribosomal protein L29
MAKAKKAEDIGTKTKDELATMLVDMKKQQFNLRFQKSQGQLANSAQIRTVRRDIARVRTFLNKQEAGASGAKKPAKAKAEKAAAAPKAKKPATKKTAAE